MYKQFLNVFYIAVIILDDAIIANHIDLARRTIWIYELTAAVLWWLVTLAATLLVWSSFDRLVDSGRVATEGAIEQIRSRLKGFLGFIHR